MSFSLSDWLIDMVSQITYFIGKENPEAPLTNGKYR